MPAPCKRRRGPRMPIRPPTVRATGFEATTPAGLPAHPLMMSPRRASPSRHRDSDELALAGDAFDPAQQSLPLGGRCFGHAHFIAAAIRLAIEHDTVRGLAWTLTVFSVSFVLQYHCASPFYEVGRAQVYDVDGCRPRER